MNLSRKWLSEFVSVEADDKEFAESMTLSGSKVELTHDLGAEIQNVVVGKVLSMEHHPDSDHMWVCQIDVGREEPVQIVTGAWNVHIDDLVPVAMHKSTPVFYTHLLGNRTLMMDSGRVVLDIGGEERKGLTVEDLLKRFKACLLYTSIPHLCKFVRLWY